ncbi:MAG: AraC family transcriptional regulator ligand-binding domain-containing protein [Rhodospirillales bacterium]|nr:AraC family transcriptional regulator ligand-binding domain-containing protein [Rhodospirillales bacterium]
MQRAASLLHLPSLLAELGVDLDEVLNDTGVSTADIRPDAFIPYASYLKVLRRSTELSRCADFGLRLGSRQTLASLGPVGGVMRCAATLGEALADFVTFQISNSTGGAVYLHASGDDFAFGYGVYDPEFEASREMYDLVVAVGCNLIRELTAGMVEPLEILMIGREPVDLAPYRALTTRPMRFEQSEACLILPRRVLAFPLKTADPAAREKILSELYQRLLRAPWGTSSRVKHALRSLMLTGVHSMREVAAHLDLHPRALRRQLKDEGTTFEAIKDEVRDAVARQLLSLTRLTAADVGLSLGYSTPSSFAHAFQRWSGMSPARWRRRSTDGQVLR